MKGIVSKTVVGMLLVTALIAVPVTADITIPWDTVSTGTYQQWTFSSQPTSWTGIVADAGYTNPYAGGTNLPVASITTLEDPGPPLQYAYGPVYEASYGPEVGLVYGGPIMQLDLWIPNAPAPDFVKIVQVEIEFFCQPGGGYIAGSAKVDPDNGPVVPLVEPFGVKDLVTDGWHELTLTFPAFPQEWTRTGEWITLQLHDSGVHIDKIEVATVCVPVPGAVLLGMLGLGFAGVKLRRLA